MAEEPDEKVRVHRRTPANAAPSDEASTVQDEGIVGGDEVEATRAEIEQTRAEMTETMDALEEKRDPQKIKEQAKTRATFSVRETARRNPAVPLAVGGVLLLLLLRSQLRNRSRTVVLPFRRVRSG